MRKVVVLVPFDEQQMARIKQVAGSEFEVVHYPDGLQGQPLAHALEDAEVVIGEPDPQVFSQATGVRLLQMTWAGTDRYTRSAFAFPRDTALCNAVGCFGHIISQHVLGQILAITLNLAGYRDLQLCGEWGDLGGNMSLDGSKVLIFGAGNIGSDCARRLTGFDVADITGVCRSVEQPREGFDRLVTLEQAEELLPESDVVICALPSTDQTSNYLNKRRLRLMRQGAVLVNVGRGDFIDCKALAAVLDEGLLRGAALDVTSPEPLPADHPLWEEPRCLITPHVSGGSFRHPGTAQRICNVVCENLSHLVADQPLRNRVI